MKWVTIGTGESVKFDYCRRYGVEIEVNALDGKSHPEVEGAQPDGIQLVANIVAQTLNCRCEIHKWGPTHFNNVWAVKPDGSCGMEVCSPVLKGLGGVYQIGEVVGGMSRSQITVADQRCALHVHAEIADLLTEQLGSVLAHWVKCEYTMLLAMPDWRKKNRYCQVIGMSDLLRADHLLSPQILISRLGAYKYYTMNTFHHARNKRPTVEVRIADEGGCLDPAYVMNWVKLVIHFIEVAAQAGYPPEYSPSDPHSGYLWLFPADVIKFLKFDKPEELCSELRETRDWFIGRISRHARSKLGGIWDDRVLDRVLLPTLAA